MTKLIYAASAAALLTVAGTVPSIAQSSSSGVTAPTITCRDLSTMDRETARSVVFYFSGYQTGSGMAMSNQASMGGASGSSGTMDTSGASGSSSTSADAGSSTSGSTTGTTGSDTSTSADAGTSGSTTGTTTSADAGSGSSTVDTTGSTSTAGGNSDTSSGATGGASSAVVAQLPGFNTINVDRIMSDCQNSPDKQLSELIQSGAGAAQ